MSAKNEKITVSENTITINALTDTTLIEAGVKDAVLAGEPNAILEKYVSKEGGKETTKERLVFTDFESEELPAIITKLNPSNFDEDLAMIDPLLPSESAELRKLAVESFKVNYRAKKLAEIKDRYVEKGVGGFSPEASAKRRYIAAGGTFTNGEPDDNATVSVMGMTVENVTLDYFIETEKSLKK